MSYKRSLLGERHPGRSEKAMLRAEIARLTQERDAAVAAAVEACAKVADDWVSNPPPFKADNAIGARAAAKLIAEGIRSLNENAALELERIRAAIAELEASPSVGASGAGTSPPQELLNVSAYRLAELQRREKELLSNLQDTGNRKKS
jgi:hypothetical protein